MTLCSTYSSCAVTGLSVIAPGVVCGGMGPLLRVWKPAHANADAGGRRGGENGSTTETGGSQATAAAASETTMAVLPSTAVIHLIRPCHQLHDGAQEAGARVRVAVCGHKQVVIVAVTTAPRLSIEVVWRLPELDDLVVEAEWVHTMVSSAAAGSGGGAEDLALVYAHNLVEVWPYNSAAAARRVLATDRSLLYSAKVMPQVDGTAPGFYVAAGTVFSEVLIWSGADRAPAPAQEDGGGGGGGNAEAPVECKLTGHQGVIMAIDVTVSVV